jgi:hypothetical protein
MVTLRIHKKRILVYQILLLLFHVIVARYHRDLLYLVHYKNQTLLILRRDKNGDVLILLRREQ